MTRRVRNTSTTSFGAITADAAATSSVTLTPATRCHWTRARTTTLVACSAAHAATVTATSKYGAAGIAATRPTPLNVLRRGVRLCRRAQFLPVLEREARPPLAKLKLKWQSAYPATGTGAPSKPVQSGGPKPNGAILILATHTTPRSTIKRPKSGREPRPRRTCPLAQHKPLRCGVVQSCTTPQPHQTTPFLLVTWTVPRSNLIPPSHVVDLPSKEFW